MRDTPGRPDRRPDMPVSTADDTDGVGRLAHEMNNAVASIVTHLNLVTEEIEQLPMAPEQRRRLLRFLDEATEGGMRVSDLIRQMKVLSWGGSTPSRADVDESDTWDVEATQGHRVLVIDDEPSILASVERALKAYEVVTTTDGADALRRLRGGESYDLVLCDLVMPGTSGQDLYVKLRSSHPEIAERMVFMTAGAFTPETRMFLSRVRNPVLHKPFDTKTLRWMIAQARRRLG